MYIAIEQSYNTINDALRSESHGIPTNPRVHVTTYKCQSGLKLLKVHLQSSHFALRIIKSFV